MNKEREALATPPLPVQEPVAWMYQHPNNHLKTCYQTYKPNGECAPLYTTPPQRPWVGLTDEDITKIDQRMYPTWKDEVQAIEARLKELNNG